MSLSAADPITATFELRQEMKRVASVEKEFAVRDWSLITGRGGGGYKTGEGGYVKFYPYEMGGGAETVLAMLKGGTTSFEVVFNTEACLAIMMGGGGGRKKFPPFKRGGRKKFYPVLRGGGAQKVSDPRFSHFVAPPPLPVINDQSLSIPNARTYTHISSWDFLSPTVFFP